MTRTLEIKDGDVVIFRSSGRLSFLEDKDKARQSMRRLLNLESPDGAGLQEIVGQVPESEFAISAAIQSSIREAFDDLVRTQRSGQLTDRTAAERLSSISRMFVVPARIGGTSSKTGYALRVDVLTVAGQSITLGFPLVPPQGG